MVDSLGLVTMLSIAVGFGWTVRIIAFLELAMMGSATILIQSRLPRSKAGGRPLIMPKTFITHPAYSCLGISYFCFAFGYFFFLFYCGTFALNIGAGAAAPYVLIACNAASWLGRITSGFAADKVGYFNLLSLNLIAAFVIMFAWMSISSVTALFVAAIFYGIVTGGVIAMQVPASLITTKDLGCAGTLMGQIFGKQGFTSSFELQVIADIVSCVCRLSMFGNPRWTTYSWLHSWRRPRQANGQVQMGHCHERTLSCSSIRVCNLVKMVARKKVARGGLKRVFCVR